jgi:ribosome maturation protein SDO1
MPQLIRYQSGKKKFEVLTKDGSVRKYREGKVGWNHVLEADVIFTNQKRGNVASASDLREIFGSEDLQKCLEIIVKDGDLQVNAQERKEDMDQHRRAVAGYLQKNYIDGRNNLPFPTPRLWPIIDESKVRLDPSGNVPSQAEEIVKRMLGVVLFKKSAVECVMQLKHEYIAKCQGIVHKMADIRKERWTADGCEWELCLVPSNVDAFMSALNKSTDGDYTITWESGASVSTSTSSSAANNPNPSKVKKCKKKKKKRR